MTTPGPGYRTPSYAECARCGYSLEGLEPETPCPECGTMPQPREYLPERVRCVACDYSLEGLPFDSICPECGVGVRWSMRGPLLEQSDPAYVHRLRRGAGWVCNSLLAVVVLAISLGTLRVVLRLATPPTMGVWPGVFAAITGVVLWMLALSYLAHYWGWWLLASADPGVQIGDKARRVTHISVQAGAVLGVGAIVISITGSFPGVSGSILATLDRLVFFHVVLSAFAFLTVFISGLLYLKQLALRVPSRKVRRMAGFRVWFCPLLAVPGFGAYFLCLPLIGPVVALVLYYNLIARLRGELIVVERRIEQAQNPAPAHVD